MPDPINPQDHEIPIASWEDIPLEVISSGDGTGREDWYGPMAHKLALTEAIHQTFERDAENQRRADQWAEMLASNSGEDSSSLVPNRDPDTPIDRLARLIVDGEYRRRQAEGRP